MKTKKVAITLKDVEEYCSNQRCHLCWFPKLPGLPANSKDFGVSVEIQHQLYNCLFHFNHFRGNWSCFHRDEKSKYFNGQTAKIGFGNSADQAYLEYVKLSNNEVITEDSSKT